MDIFNINKGSDCREDHTILFDSIQVAQIIEGAIYNVPEKLIGKINTNIDDFGWLHFQWKLKHIEDISDVLYNR